MSHSRFLLPALPFVMSLLAAAPPARAADGRIPIASAPFTISAPGRYYLTQNLAATGAGITAISIASGDVDLDLGGHAVVVAGTGTTYGVSIGAVSDVSVHDGVLSGASFLVYQSFAAGTVANLRLERLRLYNTGSGAAISILATAPGVATGSLVSDNQIYSPGPSALDLRGLIAGRVAGNLIRGAGSVNVRLADSLAVDFSGNQLYGTGIGLAISNTAAGLSGHTIARNTLMGYFAGFAIQLNGSQDNFILQNTIVRSGTAISVTNNSDGNVIEGNAVTGCISGLNILAGGGTKNIYSNNRFANDATAMQVTATGNQSGGGNCDGSTCS